MVTRARVCARTPYARAAVCAHAAQRPPCAKRTRRARARDARDTHEEALALTLRRQRYRHGTPLARRRCYALFCATPRARAATCERQRASVATRANITARARARSYAPCAFCARERSPCCIRCRRHAPAYAMLRARPTASVPFAQPSFSPTERPIRATEKAPRKIRYSARIGLAASAKVVYE